MTKVTGELDFVECGNDMKVIHIDCHSEVVVGIKIASIWLVLSRKQATILRDKLTEQLHD